MRTYVTRPSAFRCKDDVWLEDRQTCDVIVSDDAPIDTGLLDAAGERLYRVELRGPIGFVGSNTA